MNRKELGLAILGFLALGTVIGAYAGTVGVNNLFGFTNGYGFTWLNSTNVEATEYYRGGVNYTATIETLIAAGGGPGATGSLTVSFEYICWDNVTGSYYQDGQSGVVVGPITEQQCLEWAYGNSTGGTILIKAAVWDVIGLSDATEGITIMGEGRGATILRATGAGDVLTLAGTNQMVSNMEIDGNDVANDGVVLSGARTRALHLYIEDCTEAGVEISASGGAFCDDVRVKQIGGSVRAVGTRGIDITTNGADIEVINCILSECEFGIRANGGTNRMMQNHIWGNTKGITLSPDNSHGEHIITHNFIEDQQEEGIAIIGHSVWSVLISDNIIDYNARSGGFSNIRINPADAPAQYDATGILITNNVYDNITSTSPGTAPDYCILIDEASSGDLANIRIEGENFNGADNFKETWDQSNPPVLFSNPGANCTIGYSTGYITENSGTGSITSGGTTDVITHGLHVTPLAQDIVITLTENPTNTPGAIWVDTIGATQFTVNCENDPGASNLNFSWKVEVNDFR